MPRILLTGDTHLGFDLPKRGDGPPHRRGADFFNNFHRVLEFARVNSIQLLLHGGDLFHRSQEPPAVVERAFQALHELASSGTQVGLIAGNHERSALPPSLFMQHANIRLFHEPSTHVFDVEGMRIGVTGVPFIRDDVRANLPRVIASLPVPPCDARLLLVHQAIEGAVVGPADYVFKDSEDVVNIASLPPGFRAYISGHIHRKQVLWKRGDDGKRIPILYPGSTERTSFAEKSETKGFMVLELGAVTGKIHFEPLPSRPMLDVHAREASSVGAVREVLTRELQHADPRSIIRLHVSEGVWTQCSRKALSPPVLPAMPLIVRPPGSREQSMARMLESDDGE